MWTCIIWACLFRGTDTLRLEKDSLGGRERLCNKIHLVVEKRSTNIEIILVLINNIGKQVIHESIGTKLV